VTRDADFLDVAEAQEAALRPSALPDAAEPASGPAAAPSEAVNDKPARRRYTKYTEDQILDWWVAYEDGLTFAEVDRRFGLPTCTARQALVRHGLVGERPKRPRRKVEGAVKASRATNLDERLEELRQIKAEVDAGLRLRGVSRADFSMNENDIMDCLRKMAGCVDEMTSSDRRPLPVAQALEHVKPIRASGTYVPQSARQREMDRLGASARRGVRDEMRAAGLLPVKRSHPMSSQRYFT
jgi:hypothetical protein